MKTQMNFGCSADAPQFGKKARFGHEVPQFGHETAPQFGHEVPQFGHEATPQFGHEVPEFAGRKVFRSDSGDMVAIRKPETV